MTNVTHQLGVSMLLAAILGGGSLLHAQDAPRRLPQPGKSQLLGIDLIERRFPDLAPSGGGIRCGHVEGERGRYMPAVSEPIFRGVMFSGVSGASRDNGHTNATAKIIYGPYGLAPGVRDVWCYTSKDWLGPGFLRTGTAEPPLQTDRHVFNHSWVGLTGGDSPVNLSILRRVDYVIDEHDVIMVVGVNNGKESEVPPVLSSAYNVIAVGHWNGHSSGGFTKYAGAGRSKPDVVAPGSKTSFATAAATGVVARLLETAQRLEADVPTATRSEVIRAALLNGAAKLRPWKQQPGKPLDERFGAGRIRFDHSFLILSTPATFEAGGPHRIRKRYGWHFAQMAPTQAAAGNEPTGPRKNLLPPPPLTAQEFLELRKRSDDPEAVAEFERRRLRIPRQALMQQKPATAKVDYLFDSSVLRGEVAITLIWNRRIDGRQFTHPRTDRKYWPGTPRMADLNLRLVAIDDAGNETIAGESQSAIDNVEHIYLRQLPPGRYRIEVWRADDLNEPWDYALAWRIANKPAPPPPELSPELSPELPTEPAQQP